MIILAIKTDQPLAQIRLYDDLHCLADVSWEAHKQLADTLHTTLSKILESNELNWDKIEGIVCFKGPGSFTGLRIGLSVANALAYGLNVPIVSEQGNSWAEKGINRLMASDSEDIALPEYGGSINITVPKK